MKNTNEINELRAKGAISDLGTQWDLVDNVPENNGIWKVYMWYLPDGNNYVGITSRSLAERTLNGNGYGSQPRVDAAIKASDWSQHKEYVILDDIIDKATAEKIERQVAKIKKATLNNNPGGVGCMPGKPHELKHYYYAEDKNGNKKEYRTLTDAAIDFDCVASTIYSYLNSARVFKGNRFFRIDRC